MNLDICFECSAGGDIHQHHVVPRVLGGTKTVPLCERCHGLVHGRGMVGHTRLVRKGLEKARTRGSRLGRPSDTGETADVFMGKHQDILDCLFNGGSVRNTAKITGKSTATVQKVKRLWEV